MRQFYKKCVKYSEQPATQEEKKLALVLEKIIDILNTSDYEKLKEVFSPDSSIFLSTADKKPIGLNECINRLAKIRSRIGNVYYEDVIIRVQGSQAVISAVRKIYVRGKLPHSSSRYFKCAKENGEWRIIEASFI